jgi:DNA processing protein
MKINTLSPDKHKYLQVLTYLAKNPEKLHIIGELPEERRPTVAIVGTRKPSNYGKEVTYQLSYDLAKRGVVIVSGLALGIDGIAHKAALEAGGTTLAVLANGLSQIYPATHRELAKKILLQKGAILSEYDLDIGVRPYRLLERNRIVSGLSDAIIITEAASRSGTLNTAAHALEQGKEVFVVPGNITSPLSSGCNSLLKQGAHPVTCAEDVLEIIAPDLLEAQAIIPLGSNELESNIISLIQSGTRDGDALLGQLSISVGELNQALTMLELAGTVRSLGANQWTLR